MFMKSLIIIYGLVSIAKRTQHTHRLLLPLSHFLYEILPQQSQITNRTAIFFHSLLCF